MAFKGWLWPILLEFDSFGGDDTPCEATVVRAKKSVIGFPCLTEAFFESFPILETAGARLEKLGATVESGRINARV